MKLSPEEARRRVNTFVHLEVSSQMHAESPRLVIGDRVCWRVPVHLTFPSFGDVDRVGFLDGAARSTRIGLSRAIITGSISGGPVAV